MSCSCWWSLSSPRWRHQAVSPLPEQHWDSRDWGLPLSLAWGTPGQAGFHWHRESFCQWSPCHSLGSYRKTTDGADSVNSALKPRNLTPFLIPAMQWDLSWSGHVPGTVLTTTVGKQWGMGVWQPVFFQNRLWQLRLDGVISTDWLRIIARHGSHKGDFYRLRIE